MLSSPSLSLILRRRFWVGVVAAIVLVITVGLGTDYLVLREEKLSTRAQLEGLLETTVQSTTSWLDDRATMLRMLTSMTRLRHDVTLVEAGSAEGAKDLAWWLDERATPMRLSDGMLFDTQGKILWAATPSLKGSLLASEARPYFDRALRESATITPPLLLNLGKGSTPIMLGFCRVVDERGRVAAVLGLTLHLAEFSHVLTVARPGKSGEAYAIDSQGRMVSESRFLRDLVATTVLPQATTSTVLTLEVRNPGVEMRPGYPPLLPRKAQPYTSMVASLLGGKDSLDTDGYLDYRGVRVVGAGRWLRRHDLGIIVEMDASEAYQSMWVLRSIMYGLLGLLLLALGGVLLYVRNGARMQQQMARIEAQVQQLGQYKLERKLGQGGMGEVYQARHALMRRLTAVKVMRTTADPAQQGRFEREVQLCSQLSHPNTIAIFDFGHTVDGQFYYAMEYLEGITLGALVKRFGPLPAGRVIHVLTQVCGSLSEAHELNLVHRDIKPDNIMLCRRGGIADFVKVLDFGLVKNLNSTSANLTLAEVVCGTPAYMAPEAIDGGQVDGGADLYAVAAVGYFLLTGHPIVEKSSLTEILTAQLLEAPLPPSHWVPETPADLEAVLLGTLAKQRADRPANAAALRSQLLACQAAQSWTEQDAQHWWEQHHPPSAAAAEAITPEASRHLQVQVG
jgi:eukaryotic-like serine/threonine-protein kinase